jgi:hypothetical protein
MRRILVRLVALSALAASVLALGTTVAQAKTSGAHFMSDTSATVADNGSLSVFIDEAGVGQEDVSYTLAWSATADYGCVNGGGNHPQATNKETSSTGGSETFSESPINGRVMATVSVTGTPPPAPAGFSCPSGQTLVLARVSYTATLTDTTNHASTTLGASRTFFTFKK